MTQRHFYFSAFVTGGQIMKQYYSIEEAKQFSYYRLPKALFSNKEFSGISSDAKLLYGILLERLSLSIKNGWIDEHNHAYLYFGMKQVCNLLHCSLRKCKDLFSSLENIGLLKRKNNGFGKASRIYVMNFIQNKVIDTNGLQFDYFQSEQIENFAFYTIPKALFDTPAFQSLSVESKILYGILLDRLYLSVKNNWADKEGHAYLYFTVSEAASLLHSCEKTCRKLFSDLESVDLIIRKRQGQGKPMMVYVMSFIEQFRPVNFAPVEESQTGKFCTNVFDKEEESETDLHIDAENFNENADFSMIQDNIEVQTGKICTFGQVNPAPLERQNLHHCSGKICTNGQVNSALLDRKILHSNNTDANYIDFSEPDFRNTNMRYTDLQQQQIQEPQEPVVVDIQTLLSFIKEPLHESELLAIYHAANGDVNQIQEKYSIMKSQTVRNVAGFLLAAIKRDFQFPKCSQPIPQTKQNRFCNFTQREWDFEKLEKMEQEQRLKNKEKAAYQEEILPDTNILYTLKEKVDFPKVLVQFPSAVQKVDNLLHTIALILSSNNEMPTIHGDFYVQRQIEKLSERLSFQHIRLIVHNWLEWNNANIINELLHQSVMKC